MAHSKNTNLQQAKKAKQDEFYTRMEDIENELSHYEEHFRNKVVYCNCDDPFESNFVKYFLMNFNRLGLKELIATGYATSPVRGNELDLMDPAYVLRVTDTKKYLVGTQKDLDAAGAKYFLTAEKDRLTARLIGNIARNENGNPIQISIKAKYIDENGKEKTRIVKQDLFYEAGDFRSDMSIELLKQADIVVTNEPFSLFREYVAQLMEYGKQFLILGNMNAITYKEFFPLLKENKVWLGCSSGSKEYMTTEEYAKKNPKKAYQRSGKWYTKLGNTCWFTNIDHAKRHQMIPLDLGYTYYGHEDMYPKYDNYDAINVDKVAQIPCDYEPCWFKCPHATSCRFAQTEGKEDVALCEQVCNGEIGVPISYMDKHCPEQFSIVGNGGSYSGDGSIADELFVPADSCSQNVQVERAVPPSVQANRHSQDAARKKKAQGIQENHHSQTAVSATESSECQSHSLINTAQSSSELSQCPQCQDIQQIIGVSLTGSPDTPEFSFRKCNGVIGVPISFMEKYCPLQFDIIGMDLNETVNELGIREIGEAWIELYRSQGGKGHITANMHSLVYIQNGIAVSLYRRVLIRRKDINHD